MTATTFLTQRQLMSKNMPADALSGPYAQQQKLLLYVLPVVFAVGGIAFPIGVLLYWTTSNLWTMCQQFYVIRNNPAPNTEAARAKERRDEEKRLRKGGPGPQDSPDTGDDHPGHPDQAGPAPAAPAAPQPAALPAQEGRQAQPARRQARQPGQQRRRRPHEPTEQAFQRRGRHP